MVKIRITDAAGEADGFVALAKRGRVICLSDDTYQIAKPLLKALDDLAIPYEIISEESFDRVCRSLRDSLATQI